VICGKSPFFCCCAQSAKKHGYAVESVIKKMEMRGSARNLVILDACRSPERGPSGDTPQAVRSSPTLEDEASRSWGTQRLQGGKHTLVCNACKGLSMADDGKPDTNGVYTAALLKVRCGCLWHIWIAGAVELCMEQICLCTPAFDNIPSCLTYFSG
jgi:hypothetical protein